jgi:hypothetical protein
MIFYIANYVLGRVVARNWKCICGSFIFENSKENCPWHKSARQAALSGEYKTEEELLRRVL